MTEKFTPGEWRAEITRVRFPNGKMMWAEGGDFDTQIANAALIAAAPEMYRNEKSNLHVLKTLLKVYEELQRLFSTDEDVQKALPDLPSWTFEHIISELKNRINETEETLKKARGEE